MSDETPVTDLSPAAERAPTVDRAPAAQAPAAEPYVPAGSGEWTNPGAYEVAPGVHRLPLPLPGDALKAVNVYVLDTPDGLVLVDGGWSIPEAREVLATSLALIGAGVADVRRFLVTHAHRDHYTLAAAIGGETGARVEVGRGEQSTIDMASGRSDHPFERGHYLRRQGAPDLADRVAQLELPPGDPAGWTAPTAWLGPGDLPLPGGRVLEAVETPGHTRGHLVFHDLAGGLLFAGDHVLPRITPSIGFEPVRAENPLGDFLHSLAVVRERPDALLLPAHGDVAPSVHARVDELVDHHGRRLDATLATVRQGCSTAYESARLLSWTRREHAFDALDLFNSSLAVSETAAHLDLLAAQGRLTRDLVDGVQVYGLV